MSFNDGSNLKFDKVFLATGSTPRTIPVPGIDLENVFLLRDPAHANAINAAAEGKRVVLVGTGFIGMFTMLVHWLYVHVSMFVYWLLKCVDM